MWMLGTHTLPSHTHAHIYLHSYGIHAYKLGVSPTKDFHSRIGISNLDDSRLIVESYVWVEGKVHYQDSSQAFT